MPDVLLERVRVLEVLDELVANLVDHGGSPLGIRRPKAQAAQ
jgi:hypothetical protein